MIIFYNADIDLEEPGNEAAEIEGFEGTVEADLPADQNYRHIFRLAQKDAADRARENNAHGAVIVTEISYVH